MAYTLTYWEDSNDSETHYQIKVVRLKSIEEAFTLALPHNRPLKTTLILLERHRNYKNKKWIDEKIVWEKGMDYPESPIVRPTKTKSKLINK
jgi:hypothetical protein